MLIQYSMICYNTDSKQHDSMQHVLLQCWFNANNSLQYDSIQQNSLQHWFNTTWFVTTLIQCKWFTTMLIQYHMICFNTDSMPHDSIQTIHYNVIQYHDLLQHWFSATWFSANNSLQCDSIQHNSLQCWFNTTWFTSLIQCKRVTTMLFNTAQFVSTLIQYHMIRYNTDSMQHDSLKGDLIQHNLLQCCLNTTWFVTTLIQANMIQCKQFTTMRVNTARFVTKLIQCKWVTTMWFNTMWFITTLIQCNTIHYNADSIQQDMLQSDSMLHDYSECFNTIHDSLQHWFNPTRFITTLIWWNMIHYNADTIQHDLIGKYGYNAEISRIYLEID